MNDKMKAIRRQAKSAGSRMGVRSNFSVGKPRKDSHTAQQVLITTNSNAVMVGPSIKGKPMKLIEIASGEVEDRIPYFV